MADTKVSALAAATAAAAANEIPINEAGTSKKLTVSLLRDFLGLSKTVVANAHTLASATQTEVTELSQTLVAGTYKFTYFLRIRSSSAGVGLTFAINYTGTASSLVAMLSWPDTGTTAVAGVVDDAANATGGQIVCHAVTRTEATTTGNLSTGTGGVATIDVDLFAKIEGIIIVSDGGDLELWHGSETTNNTSVMPGSSLEVSRLA